MTPARAALAFRIWQFCTPLEWDCTLHEIADALDVPLSHIKGIIRRKPEWKARLRIQASNSHDFNHVHSAMDDIEDAARFARGVRA